MQALCDSSHYFQGKRKHDSLKEGYMPFVPVLRCLHKHVMEVSEGVARKTRADTGPAGVGGVHR